MEQISNITPEPTTGSAFSFGWHKMKEHFTNLLVITIILMVAQGISGSANGSNPSFSETSLGFVIWLLIAGPVTYGCSWVFLKIVRGDSYEIKDVFAAFSKDYFEVMLANFIVTIIIVVGIIFLIIPGIIFAIKLSFVPYLVMDKQMKAMDAIKKSWEMTSGHAAQILLIGFLSFFIIIGGLLLFIVGIFPAIMWINSTMAAFYYSVDHITPDVMEAQTN